MSKKPEAYDFGRVVEGRISSLVARHLAGNPVTFTLKPGAFAAPSLIVAESKGELEVTVVKVQNHRYANDTLLAVRHRFDQELAERQVKAAQ